MDFDEFDRLAEELRARSAALADLDLDGFESVEARIASADELGEAEQALGVVLPAQYKSFMMRYGGGQFGFLDLLPVRAGRSRKDVDDIVSVSQHEFPDRSFVAVAPVGTGDYWCFAVVEGRCPDQVWFHFHDAGDPEPAADDFLDFVVRHGIHS